MVFVSKNHVKLVYFFIKKLFWNFIFLQHIFNASRSSFLG